MNNAKNVILVPAAGPIKSASNYELASKDSAFLNIGTTLAIQEIKKFSSYPVKLLVNKFEKNLYKLNPFEDIEIIEIGNTESVVETIYKSLLIIECELVLINPITSIPSTINPENLFMELGSKMIPKENWSSITFDSEQLPIFHSKFDEDSEGLVSHPFTGRILAKKNDFLSAINELIDSEKKDLIKLAEKLFNKKKIDIKYTEWLDIGHSATYASTKTNSIKSRFFNDLIYKKKSNTIEKKSNNFKKLQQEIDYFKKMPEKLKRYFPMLINVKNENNFLSYEMEYIGKPTLSEIFLFGKIGPNSIHRIFSSIERVFESLYDGEPLIKENGSWLYSEKTKIRYNNFLKLIESEDFSFLKYIYFNDFKLNNFYLPSLKKTFFLLTKELYKLERSRPFHIGHGDLCFNNILVDPIFGQINLIDPKAEKHKNLNVYGLVDKYYDLSKLNHSIAGLYDSVVNNLFHLNFKDLNNISLEIFKPKEYQIYINLFNEIISSKRINKENLRILTANLFLTMLPMHLDDKKRILAFALIGSVFMANIPPKNILI